MVKKRISSQDAANRLGVSRTTVSFILNPVRASISPETQQRVIGAAEHLGLVHAAQGIVRQAGCFAGHKSKR